MLVAKFCPTPHPAKKHLHALRKRWEMFRDMSSAQTRRGGFFLGGGSGESSLGMVFPSGKGRRRARQTSPPSLLVGPTVWGFLGCFPWRVPPSGAEAKLLVMDVLLLNVLLPPSSSGLTLSPASRWLSPPRRCSTWIWGARGELSHPLPPFSLLSWGDLSPPTRAGGLAGGIQG